MFTSFCVDICFISLGHIPRSEIAGSYHQSMFNLLRNFRTVLQSGCDIYTPISAVRALISPHPVPCFLLAVFLSIAILLGIKCYLSIVLICIFLMANDVEHLFICLLAICMSSLENGYSDSLLIFKLVHLSS